MRKLTWPALMAVLLVAIFTSAPLLGQDAPSQKPKAQSEAESNTGDGKETNDKPDDEFLKLGDIFELEFASDPQISPDGKQIVYARNSFDIMIDRQVQTLWMLESGVHRPLFADGIQGSSPRWSPDGKRIAYVSVETGKRQIHAYWVDEKQSTPLTHLTQSPSGLTWSPDGKWIAFSMRVPDKPKPFATLPAKPKGAEWAKPPEMITRLRYRADGRGYLPYGFRHLFVVSTEGGTPRQLTFGDFDHGGGASWTADSKNLVFSANRHADADYQPTNPEIYTVSLEKREVKPLTDRLGPDTSPTVSPDGKQIAYVGFDDKQLGSQANKLYLMDIDGSNNRLLLGTLDRSIQSPKWNSDGSGIYFQYDDFGDTRVALVDMNGSMTNLTAHVGGTTIGRPYSGGSYDVADDGTLVYTIASTSRPSDIGIRTAAGDTRQLTHVNEDLFAFKKLGKVEEIRFKSSHDDLELQGWIIKPPQFDESKKYPMILEIHGGPFANYGSRFSGELQLYAAQGYVVLYMNPRGSTSYGHEFANHIHHAYPGHDYDDLMSGVDEVISRGYVDEKNLFVTGGSGGGVLTAWIVGKTQRFRAAVVAKPVINWYSFALTADAYNYFYKYWFPGFPWDHPEEYMSRSPISLVGNVTTPTMLLTGTEDYRTPISESEQYYQALKLLKIDTALVRVPGASHGIAARPSHLAAKVAYILQWFENHKSKP